MSEQDGGAAFPQWEVQHVYLDERDRHGDHRLVPCGGMTLRDYFAGQALAAVAPHERADRSDADLAIVYARQAYLLADAMLQERAK